MGNGLLIVGNLVTFLIAILASLEVLPWSIAGYLIIGTAFIVLVGYLSSTKRTLEKPRNETFASKPVIDHLAVQSEEKSATPKAHGAIKKETRREISTPVDNPVSIDQQQPEAAVDSPTSIPEGDYLSYEAKLEVGEELVGEVSSSGQVNAYILDEENLSALESDQEFWYEAGSEGVKDAVLHFTAPADGVWFLIIENLEANEISARAKMNITKPSHQVPFLKSESLDLPDARLEGKLKP